jgi:hypothetical protein
MLVILSFLYFHRIRILIGKPVGSTAWLDLRIISKCLHFALDTCEFFHVFVADISVMEASKDNIKIHLSRQDCAACFIQELMLMYHFLDGRVKSTLLLPMS